MQSDTQTICLCRTCGDPWNTQEEKSKHFLLVICYVFDVEKRSEDSIYDINSVFHSPFFWYNLVPVEMVF